MKVYTLGILLFDDMSKVLLIKKNKPAWQAGKFNFPGGSVEPNESPVNCVAREFVEEAGIGIMKKEWIYIGSIRNVGILKDVSSTVTESKGAYVVEIFTAKYNYAVHGEAWSVTSEEISWHSVNSLPKECISNLHWLVPFAINFHLQGNADNLKQGVFQYEYPENYFS